MWIPGRCAEGIAITGLANAATGKWQYSTGGAWTDVGTVSATSALLLRSTDSIRFVPDGKNGGTATITYKGLGPDLGQLREQGQHHGQRYPDQRLFHGHGHGQITITALNDAPVLADTTLSVTQTEDDVLPRC